MVNRGKKLHSAFLGLGSNLGPRAKNISAALNALQTTRQIEVVKVSTLYETDPVGGPEEQPTFINAVAHLRTSLTPKRLLEVCSRIEESLGRKRAVPWGPRTIDLDILLFDREIRSDAALTIPHPMMHERRFVMEPLAEIAPNAIHPVLERTAREILESLSSTSGFPGD